MYAQWIKAKRWHNAYTIVLCLLVFVLISVCSFSQNLLKGGNLSDLNVDNLSDSSILKYKEELSFRGISMAIAEQQASAKGMQQAELLKLRERIAKLTEQQSPVNSPQSESPQAPKNEYKTIAQLPSANVFGASFFSTASLSFEPNLRIATPASYMVGPDDELVLSLTGLQEAGFKVKVQPEGFISIPQVGVIQVSGLTIEDAIERIKDRMTKTVYRSISSGATKLNISLGAIRSIRITMIGAAKPGNYTASSLSTVFNSLYISGGPGSINSYREIEVRRNNKVIQKIDLYRLLTKGDESGNVLLKENDIINFPVYKKRVTINGQVKRPGVFELLEDETLNDLIFFAGGFTDKAYTAGISVKQTTDKERRLKDLIKSEFDSYHPGNGDIIEVGTVLERVENSVSISGAVYRPGEYELTPGLTLNGLILKADGIQEDVFLKRAILVRTREDKSTENIPFSVSEILREGGNDIKLHKNDAISIASVTDFKSKYTVGIEGEIRKPGNFQYRDSLSLKDILFSAGGFTDAATAYRIEISRRYDSEGIKTVSDSIAKVYTLDFDKDLTLGSNTYMLHPFDLITVRRKPSYAEQKRVTITGEVLFPGSYTLERKDDRISDIFKRAGGLTAYAHDENVFLVRKQDTTLLLQNKLKQIDMLSRNNKDSIALATLDITQKEIKIPIEVRKILINPGSIEDFTLQEGDIINVQKYDPLVKISGEVVFSTKTGYLPGQRIKYYIGRAGGLTNHAKASKMYVLYSNGRVGATQKFIFGLFRKYPEIKPGSEIVVLGKKDVRPINIAETIGIATGLASLVSLLLVSISFLK